MAATLDATQALESHSVNCLHEGCDRKLLTSAGIYSTVRQVVDIDSNYNLAAKY